MDLGLKGKNAAITGSSQGIGFAIATALAKEGCNVALSGRGAQGLDVAVKELQALGVKAVGVVNDFASEEGCSKFVAEAASQLGGLDILVNNVGGLIPGAFEQLSAFIQQRSRYAYRRQRPTPLPSHSAKRRHQPQLGVDGLVSRWHGDISGRRCRRETAGREPHHAPGRSRRSHRMRLSKWTT